jgi:hypothetical protein
MTHLVELDFARPKVFDAIGWTASIPEAFDLLAKAPVRIEPTIEDRVEDGAGADPA